MPEFNDMDYLRDAFDANCRENFSLFLRRTLLTIHPGAEYQHNWHIEAIAEHLAAAERGEIRRLVINLPPRMLKSTIVSVAWPAWLLARNPAQRIMVASYAQSLAIKHSTDCRHVLRADWFARTFPDTVLTRDQNKKEKFATTKRGYRLGVSVGGAATGEGGNVLIVDDPLNALQARQKTRRDTANHWFDHTFATRLDNKKTGVIVVVMQRLHPEDLSGYLLKKNGWHQLILPAIAEAEQRIEIGAWAHRRSAGSALQPARDSLEEYARLREEIGSANFAAQYQQSPSLEQGQVIRPHWFPRFALRDLITAGNFFSHYPQTPQPAPAGRTVTQSWDTGFKSGDSNDASACATFVSEGNRHYLVDMLVERLEYPDLKRRIVQHAALHNPDAVLIEDKGSGQSLLQDLKRETDLPVIGCKTGADDKLSRLLRVTPWLEAGRLALPENAPWLAAFEAELYAFPDGRHDDQVDCLSQYLNWRRTQQTALERSIRRV
jgi:predicted phage terminase large subunit-like protein